MKQGNANIGENTSSQKLGFMYFGEITFVLQLLKD